MCISHFDAFSANTFKGYQMSKNELMHVFMNVLDSKPHVENNGCT